MTMTMNHSHVLRGGSLPFFPSFAPPGRVSAGGTRADDAESFVGCPGIFMAHLPWTHHSTSSHGPPACPRHIARCIGGARSACRESFAWHTPHSRPAPGHDRSRRRPDETGRARCEQPCRTAWSSSLPLCTRERESCRDSSA